MTQPDTTSSPAPQPYYDDEIDLSRYLDILIKWWKEILLIAFGTAALAVIALVALDKTSTPLYTANADLVIARLASNVTLDERITTVVEEIDGGSTTDSNRAALVALGSSGEIASAVIDTLGESLPESKQDPFVLLNMVDVTIPTSQNSRTSSNLIRIAVTADSPELASQIANAWAEEFMQKVNSVYGQVPPDVLVSLQSELSTAEDAYRSAQRNLEGFVSESQIDTLNRKIAEQQALRNVLQSERTDTLTLLTKADQGARRDVFSTLTNAQLDSRLSVFSEQIQARTKDLERLYAARNATQEYLDQARTLREQIVAGGDTTINTNAIALQLLKAQVFSSIQYEPASQVLVTEQDTGETRSNATPGISRYLPANLLFDADTSAHANADEQEQDVAALVTALENHLEDLESRINDASQKLISGEGYSFLEDLNANELEITSSIADGNAENTMDTDSTLSSSILGSYSDLFGVGSLLESSQSAVLLDGGDPQQDQLAQIDGSIQVLRSQVAAEQEQERYLTQQRDLAWNTFDALSNKAAELNMELSSANRQVRIGSFAIPPTKPIEGRSFLVPAVLSFAFGLLLGIVVAFLANYLGYEPFLRRSKQPA